MVFFLGIGMPSREEIVIGVNNTDWWKVIFITPLFAAILRMLLIVFIFRKPETPYYLLIIGDRQSAKERIERIYLNSHQEMLSNMLKQKENSSNSGAKLTYRELMGSKHRTPILYGIFVISFFGSSGIDLFLVYSSKMFIFTTPAEHLSVQDFTFLVGLIKFCLSFVSGFFLDRFGRKTMLLLGNSLCALFLLIISYLAGVSLLEYMKYIILLHVICFGSTIGPGTHVYLSDTLEDVAYSVVKLAGWMNSFLSTALFPYFVTSFGLSKALMIWVVWSAINAKLTYSKLKETKGLTKF